MGLLKSYQSLANLERYQGNSSSLTLLNVSQERVQNWCLQFSSKSLKMEKLCQVTLSSLFNSDTQPCQSAPQKNLHYLKHKLPNFYSFTLFPSPFSPLCPTSGGFHIPSLPFCSNYLPLLKNQEWDSYLTVTLCNEKHRIWWEAE